MIIVENERLVLLTTEELIHGNEEVAIKSKRIMQFRLILSIVLYVVIGIIYFGSIDITFKVTEYIIASILITSSIYPLFKIPTIF